MASGSSLISLFKFACDAWDFIQLYRAYDADYKKLQLQFELEKCRLYTWGSEMGLADNSRPNILDGWHSTALVTACLQQIISMLSDGSGISEKYGCDEMSPATTPLIDQGTTRSGGIATAFDQFKIEVPTRDTHQPNMLRKSKWVVRDRKKFRLLIEEVRGLVDSLCSVTTELSSKSRMEEVLRSRIKAIPDIETLLMIATAWKESYPRIASAASTQAESLSMSSGRQGAIFEWQTMVASEASEGTLIQDLEDLTITELKHSVIRSNQEIESLRNALEETKGHTTIMMSQMTTIDGNAKSQRTSTVVVSAFVLTYVPITFYMTYAMGLQNTLAIFPLSGPLPSPLWVFIPITLIAFIISSLWVTWKGWPRKPSTRSETHDTTDPAAHYQKLLATSLKAAREDASSMKILTILMLLFLPGTFFATFFSLGGIHWHDESVSNVWG